MDLVKQTPKKRGVVQCLHSMEKQCFFPGSVWKDKLLDGQRKKPAGSDDFITVLGKPEADYSVPAIGIITL